MKTRGFVLLMLSLVAGTLSYGAAAPQAEQPEVREYIAEDGRRIAITSLGNLITLETPRGFEHAAGGTDLPLDGYVLAYRDPSGTVRVLHNVYRSHSSTIKAGLPDFVPISFEAPPSGTEFERGSVVGAKVVVGTRDGLVEIHTTYSWIGGIVRVESAVRSVSQTIRLLAFKRQIRLAPDANGAFGILDSKFDVLATEAPPVGEFFVAPSVVFAVAICCRRGCDPILCPPRMPEFSELTVNSHSILFQAGPDGSGPKNVKPSYLTVADAADDCERLKAGACAGSPLPRLRQDSLATAGWLVNRKLVKDGSVHFLTRITVF
jgi:hypothetical protein